MCSLKQRMKLYINCKIPSSYLQHIHKKNYIYNPKIWILTIAARDKIEE